MRGTSRKKYIASKEKENPECLKKSISKLLVLRLPFRLKDPEKNLLKQGKTNEELNASLTTFNIV